MSEPRDTTFWLRLSIAAISIALPSLTLVPFGGLWMWQHGYALHWVIGACVFVVAMFLAQLFLFKRLDLEKKEARVYAPPEDAAAESWTPRENEAWKAVLAVADTADLSHLASWPAFWGLGKRTIEAVAKSVHPEVKDPLWQFTAPEALTVIEQVSHRLKPMAIENVPLGDKLTIGQIIQIYQWRGVVDTAQKGYDLWRLIRMLNPATAVTQELRERLSREMYRWGREELGKRLARAYVKEVGRAAIDLYAGRLRVAPEDLEAHVTKASARDRKAMKTQAEPLRVLICGQVNAGKSSLVNALLAAISAGSDALPLTNEFTAYEIKREGAPEALIIDSPGLDRAEQPLEKLVGEATQADLILWVASAVRADRDLDARALAAIRDYFATHPNRRRPPMLLVLSHIDRLRPMQEWAPPYDLADATNPKAASIRAAMDAAGGDLGFAEADVVPACLDAAVGLYNVDAVWAGIMELMAEAQRAQLVRTLTDLDRGFDWRRLRKQAVNAGRILTRVVLAGGGKK